MFTRPKTNTKEVEPKESLKDLVPVSPEFFTDFLLGLEFGSFEKQYNFKWKYGQPWLYPADEFEMLKTAIRVMNIAEIQKFKETRAAKTDMVKALGISEEVKEKNKTASKSMASFFKSKD